MCFIFLQVQFLLEVWRLSSNVEQCAVQRVRERVSSDELGDDGVRVKTKKR